METIRPADVCKVDETRRLVYGWAYVAVQKGEPVVDHSGDVLDTSNLEDVVVDYVLHSREGGEMHVAKGVSRLAESFVVTPEKLATMGLTSSGVEYGWWVGFKVDDDATWAKVQKGELRMFSIAGSGTRETMDP